MRAAATALTMTALLTGVAGADPAAMSASPAPAETLPASGSLPLATPAAALASPDPARMQAMMQSFLRMHDELSQLHAQTRSQMLGALSPAHRALVATLVGQLAVAPNPDQAVAARQLDATLSPTEQQAVLRLDAAATAQMLSFAQTIRTQIEASLPADQRAALERQATQMRALAMQAGGRNMVLPRPGAQDAGSVLLRALAAPNALPGFVGHFSTSANAGPATIVHGGP